MGIEYPCPSCGNLVRWKDRQIGDSVKCPNRGVAHEIPNGAKEAIVPKEGRDESRDNTSPGESSVTKANPRSQWGSTVLIIIGISLVLFFVAAAHTSDMRHHAGMIANTFSDLGFPYQTAQKLSVWFNIYTLPGYLLIVLGVIAKVVLRDKEGNKLQND